MGDHVGQASGGVPSLVCIDFLFDVSIAAIFLESRAVQELESDVGLSLYLHRRLDFQRNSSFVSIDSAAQDEQCHDDQLHRIDVSVLFADSDLLSFLEFRTWRGFERE